jgi:cell division protein FtsQ
MTATSTASRGSDRRGADLVDPERWRWRSPALWVPLGVLAVLLAVAVWAVGFTGLFGVRTVTVTGDRALREADILAVAAVSMGKPLARIDTGAVADRVRHIPGVARVAVTRSWPSTLRIAVTERQGVAVVRRSGAPWLVDAEGVVFQRLRRVPAGLPRLDVRRPGPGDPATRAALSAVAALTPAVRARLQSISAETAGTVTLRLVGDRTVLWGGAESGEAKAVVLEALLRRPGTRYDVSTPEAVTVR